MCIHSRSFVQIPLRQWSVRKIGGKRGTNRTKKTGRQKQSVRVQTLSVVVGEDGVERVVRMDSQGDLLQMAKCQRSPWLLLSQKLLHRLLKSNRLMMLLPLYHK